MARGTTTVTTLMFLAPIGAIVTMAAGRAEAAAPTYYANQAAFQAEITNTVTDDYSNPGYVFIQNDAVMSAVLGQTDYMSTGFNNLNIVSGGYYCAGCNGSFELSFQTTTVGNAIGVHGVGVTIPVHSLATPYFAYITFGDGTTANIPLPAAGSFWGVSAPERIERIHFGLSMGGTTQSGSFGIDDLIVGDGNVGPCMQNADCISDGDPCTDTVCAAGMCTYPFNTAPCDDGNQCTLMDTCSAGICMGSESNSCDDGNICTTNLCDPVTGCFNQLNTNPCDDGNLCTDMDVCSAGVCVGTMLDCDDGDACSMDSCDPERGVCVHEPTAACCLDDEDCGPAEICDLETNACVPTPSGTESSSTAGDDTGADEAGLDDTGGGGTGVGDTLGLSTGPADSTGDGTGIPADGGEIPPPDFSVCVCTTMPNPQGRLWWLLAGLGLFLRRRRAA